MLRENRCSSFANCDASPSLTSSRSAIYVDIDDVPIVGGDPGGLLADEHG